jgi:hypothetical protein
MDRSKPAPSASSSDDLERARQLSQRLKGTAGSAPAASSPYVSFGARAEAPAPAAPPAVGRVAPPVPPAQSRPSLPLMARREPLRAPAAGFGPQAWNRLLDGCATAVAADAAFLMDPHGLVVAARGPRATEEVEAVGARLMVAFDQADRIEGAQGALTLTVESPRGSLHGLRLRQPDGSFLTLGLVVPGGLTAERQARVLAVVTASASSEPPAP